MSDASLVVFGSGGRHVSFTKHDLKLPALTAVREEHGEAAVHFIEKQWPTLCTFWMNRVLKDTKLQHLTVDDVIAKILAEALHRFLRRKEEQQLHKKRKRLLENKDPDKGAGIATRNVLVVNFVSLKTYLVDKPASDALIEAVLEACRLLVGGRRKQEGPEDGPDAAVDDEDEVHTLFQHRIMVDADGELPLPSVEEPPQHKGHRTEGEPPTSVDDTATDATATGSAFDDRVALVISCASIPAAATIVAKLHSRVLDGRVLSCRFIDD